MENPQNPSKKDTTPADAAPMAHISSNPEYYNLASGETGLAARTLPPSARRSIAALWFAAFAALATFLFFLRLVMAPSRRYSLRRIAFFGCRDCRLALHQP